MGAEVLLPYKKSEDTEMLINLEDEKDNCLIASRLLMNQEATSAAENVVGGESGRFEEKEEAVNWPFWKVENKLPRKIYQASVYQAFLDCCYKFKVGMVSKVVWILFFPEILSCLAENS